MISTISRIPKRKGSKSNGARRSTTGRSARSADGLGDGQLTSGLLTELRQGFEANPAYKRAMNAVTQTAVDDVALNRALVAGYFEGTAHKLIAATNGLEALELAEKHRPDVILMDMRMPELDGHETTKRLKANPALKHIPVIAVTASSFREEEARARKTCDGFIRKPFNRGELVAELQKFLKPAAAAQEAAPGGRVPASKIEFSAPAPAEAVARRPELMAALREQEQTVWPRLCKTKAMTELEAFAQRLRRWAEEGHWPPLRSYAETLDQQVQEFDLSRLPQTLQRFPEVIASLP